MNQPGEPSVPNGLVMAVAWSCVAAVILWGVAVYRLYNSAPVLPLARRRRVPWGALEVVLVLTCYFGLQIIVASAMRQFLPSAWLPGQEEASSPEKANNAHAITRLLQQGDPWIIALGALLALVIAPVVEEVIFRMALQGWLEAAERRLRRDRPASLENVPYGMGPILISSTVFAALHIRVPSEPPPWQYLAAMMSANAVTQILICILTIIILRDLTSANWRDLGLTPRHLPGDIALGLVAALMVVGPTLVANLVLTNLLPQRIAPDPITLFCFALALGTLYYRTHRLWAPILLHMALNATSLAIFLLSRPAG